MVIRCSTKDFYLGLEGWALEQIRASQQSISLMAEVRELYAGDWEIEELTRAIIFDEVQFIEEMKGEAERARATGKEFARV